VAGADLDLPSPPVVLYCDNRGILSHGNNPTPLLLQKQKQANLIRLIKFLSGTNNGKVGWEWVEGHAVESRGWACCTLLERLNDQADRLAKHALISAIAGRAVIGGDLPFEVVKLSLSRRKVSGSIREALEVDWGYRAAEYLFEEKGIVRRQDFHLIWWEGLGAVMARYPKMYRVWLTKHVSEFCGNNVQLYYWSQGVHSPKCESCGTYDEYTTHIGQCRDPGQDQMFRVLVAELREWLATTLGELTVSLTVESYLLSRGEVTMVSCLHGNCNDLRHVAECSDCLGWDSLVEGWVSSHWLELGRPFPLAPIALFAPKGMGATVHHQAP
jgi:hypothetical protein